MQFGWLVTGFTVLGLAGCAENSGWNPNYVRGSGPYGGYLAQREVALVTNGTPPSTIPITLPAEAPTAGEIAGRTPVPVVRGARVSRASSADVPVLPVTTTGPYPGTTPVLTRYAFDMRHSVGTPMYPRTITSPAQTARLCAGFAGPDAAQTAFLAAGGPQRDPRLLDPDGDGYVCGWNPATVRQQAL